MSLKPYPAYKDSGVAWLGEVPEQWQVQRLKLAFVVTASNVDKKSYDGQRSIRLCNYTDVYYNDKITDALDFMEATATDEQIEKFALRSGDVIITKDSETADDIAIPAYIPKDLPGVICGYHLSMIRPRGENDGLFLKYLFECDYLKACWEVLANGLTRVGLGQSALENVVLPIPKPLEQTAIAEFLDRETGKIDDLIAEQEKLIALLAEKRQATISHAVTKGPNPAAPMEDSGVEWLGQIPAHWRVEKAKYIFSKSSLPPPVDAEVVTCFRNGQVTLRRNRREDGFTFAELEHGYQGIIPGQLVLHSMDAFAGAIGVSDSFGKCSPEYLVCDSKCKENLADYYGPLLRLMASRGFILAACPSVRERAPRIRFPDFGEMLLPVPPAEEQRSILALIRRSEEQATQLIAVALEAIALMKERRTALISAAVTGKIDVRRPSAEIIDLAVARRRLRGMLAVEFIEKSQGRPTFGRTALQKHAYLAEAFAGVHEIAGKYVRNDYGPLDRDMIDDMESEAQRLCGIVTQSPTGTNRSFTYLLSRPAGTLSDELAQKLGPDRSAKLQRLHALLAPLNTHDVEGVATLFAVWNDFLIEQKTPSDDDLVNGFLNDWHPRKSENFNAQELRLRLDWMRRNGLVPTGAGPKTETGRLFV